MRVITDAEVGAVLDLATTTDWLERALGDLGRQRAASSIRVRATTGGAMASALAAAWPDGGVTGGKVYATKDGVLTFLVAVFDLDGRLLAVMEGDTLTRIRTAAGTGVALRHLLARPPEVVTVIGTGRQCRQHLELVAAELPGVGEVRIVGRRPGPRDTAVRAAVELELPAVGMADPVEAVQDAGVVITLTSASRPLFPGDRLPDGALVCALGATKHDRQELGPDTVARAGTVVVDSLEGSRTECGDLIAAAAAGSFRWDDALELAPVVADPALVAGRTGHDVVLFESQGIALQDIVAAAIVVERIGTGVRA